MNFSTALRASLTAALTAKGPSYQARTQHMQNGQPIYTNRLILEDSPYLLQHAHNPVNWYAWGEEAFATAAKQNKPIFLSIGYATCHWCHVMEEESFESIQIADILNAHFIAIKVDREQHPDIDQTYMTAVTMITGRGGWPMSSFLCPDGKPFYGGTYYQPSAFSQLLLNIEQAWQTQNKALLEQAKQLAGAIHKATSSKQRTAHLEKVSLQIAVDSILDNYDSLLGGFSAAPKFPNEPLLLLLLQTVAREPNPISESALYHTLSAMAQGGIYDQVGGGFHRYAVDDRWLVPHFEKMLYNQAYLSRVYGLAFALTANPIYKRIAKQTLDYVLREMRTSEGVFYSATDADSEGHEGTYFVWHEDEIKQLLGELDAQFIATLFGTSRHGNFEGKNIFYLPESLHSVAQQNNLDLPQLFNRLDPLLEKLRKYRAERIPPLTDNKIIVAWNGMLICALVEVAEQLHEPRYIAAAKQAAEQLWQTQRDNQQALWRTNLDGKVSIPGKQDDYVHFAEALLALYDASAEPHYLQRAKKLCDEMLDKFLDQHTGALTMGNDSLLFTQPKDAYDGALPSGNAVAIRVLSRLSRRCNNPSYAQQAETILQAFSKSIIQQPAAYAYMLAQMDELNKGEIGSRQYAAGGMVKIEISQVENNFVIDLNIGAGYAITAQSLVFNPAQQNNNQISYPHPSLKKVMFQDAPLSIFQDHIQVIASQTKHAITYPWHGELHLQVCDQTTCLPEQTITLTLFR